MAKAIRKQRAAVGQKALIVGVSDYPAPIPKLPAVTGDVKEMARLLRSKDGAFSAGVTLLADRQATRQAVLAALTDAFGQAKADETLFVYLAGHGDVEAESYYFVAHDTDAHDLRTTGVSLAAIKALFDKTASSRAFLWLDFCHCGGILTERAAKADDRTVLRRTLEVVRGEGKIIVAACTPRQSAYENASLGHGLFTDALLRGLKGDASSGGEVTANSLFDFIDREIGSQRQRPMFFGHTTGRLVLMHYHGRGGDSGQAKPKTAKAAPAKPGGTWILLGQHYFRAQTIKSSKDGSTTLVISPANGDEEANLAGFRPGPFGGGPVLPFAWNNEAGSAQVSEVESELAGNRPVWTIMLSPQDKKWGSVLTEMAINTGSKTYSAEDIARLRAGRILLNDPPEVDDRKSLSFNSDSFLESSIRGSSGQGEVRGSPIRQVYAEHGKRPDWKHFARLQAVFRLKTSGTVDHILELELGQVRAGKLAVRFRGRRERFGTTTVIEITGQCPLE